MNWMDVCIIMIISISAFIGLSRGLILSVFSIGSYILAFIAAKIYYPHLSSYIIENTNIISKIRNYVFDKINIIHRTSAQGHDNIIETVNFPKALEKSLIKRASIDSSSLIGDVNGYISEIITKIFLDLACIIIIFFAVKLALNLIGALFNSIASLPVINQFNRLGGFFFGTVKGIIIVFILTAMMVPAASIFSESFIAKGIEGSMLASYFYDYNLVLNIIYKVINNTG